MTLIHTPFPSFSLQAFHDGDFKTLSDNDLREHWSIVFFYPGDFTFVCPTELADLHDHREAFAAQDCRIYSVSTDSHFCHKAWHDHSDTVRPITYPMIADPLGVLARSLGVLDEPHGVAHRATFLVDPQGIIQYVEITPPGVGRDAQELLRKVQAARYVAQNPSQVCPAQWKPGSSTLTPSLDLVGKI